MFGGFPMYGLLYSVTVLLLLIPMLLISDAGLGHYPSFGLEVRINKPATIMADADEELMIVTVGVMHASLDRRRKGTSN